ncbi:TPA: hypothetical protein N0F65_008894 [Lagenidium giganteum]|uniref:FYVE-type domain-containing protein n=1 Tax=Lagenidium giganteum TaxID=4803 RepID=A0AAV2YY35_9STRA|nr:TPA: hypothetical protein N0F65_008894 [Lagenidium giganteum]
MPSSPEKEPLARTASQNGIEMATMNKGDDGGARDSPSEEDPQPAVAAAAAAAAPALKDNGLRIFFPTDDLALKAILSPPHLQSASSSGRLSASNSSSNLTSKSADGSPKQGPTNNDSSLFDKLLFRGSTGAGSATATSKSSTGCVTEEDIDRINTSVRVVHQSLPPPPFANMFSCENCRDDIGSLLGKGRHHCRNCGGSFCADCSSRSITVPYHTYLNRGEQRVCDSCFHRIRDFHTQAQTTDVTWNGLAPPSNEEFIKAFDLPATETPVTIFNCCYFIDFSPFYGHLFLTREHVCFKGYKAEKIKVPFAQLHSLIKPEFYYINALLIKTKAKEKFFFAEFNGFRDLCFLRLDQLVRAYNEGNKLQQLVSREDLVQQALVRRKSYRVLAGKVASASTPQALQHLMARTLSDVLDEDLEDDDEDDDDSSDDDGTSAVDSAHESTERESFTSSDDETSFEPLPPDVGLPKMTMLLDCDLHADVQVVFNALWGNGAGQDFLNGVMEKSKDIDIEIEDWQPIDGAGVDRDELTKGVVISKESDYSQFRHVRSQHPPKTSFPGLPPYATCNRIQRVRVEKSEQGDRWNRFVISDMARMSKIPFSDYFEIETRWVFSRDGKNYCHAQAALTVHFLRSTWFKSQISSSTVSESKEVFEMWLQLAILTLQKAKSGSKGTKQRDTKIPAVTAEGATSTQALPTSATAAVENSYGAAESPSRRKPRKTVSFPATQSTAVAPPSMSSATVAPSIMLYVNAAVVLLLLYCVWMLRAQQHELRELTRTTSILAEQVRIQSNALQQLPGAREQCHQATVEGAIDSLREYFQTTNS